jgi:hypothetical protein
MNNRFYCDLKYRYFLKHFYRVGVEFGAGATKPGPAPLSGGKVSVLQLSRLVMSTNPLYYTGSGEPILLNTEYYFNKPSIGY